MWPRSPKGPRMCSMDANVKPKQGTLPPKHSHSTAKSTSEQDIMDLFEKLVSEELKRTNPNRTNPNRTEPSSWNHGLTVQAMATVLFQKLKKKTLLPGGGVLRTLCQKAPYTTTTTTTTTTTSSGCGCGGGGGDGDGGGRSSRPRESRSSCRRSCRTRSRRHPGNGNWSS